MLSPRASTARSPALFVTGTDTGVGKTRVTTALIRSLRAEGIDACGMKPIAAGAELIDGEWRNDDVEAIVAASEAAYAGRSRRALIAPCILREPASPHIAAAQQSRTIDMNSIARAFEDLSAISEAVIVEGAGGWLVPLSEEVTIADLCASLELPVLLVVGMRLGCLNHALLTAEAIHHRRLTLAGWVANHIDPGFDHVRANVDTLVQRLGAPLWAEVPYSPSALPDDPRGAHPRTDIEWLVTPADALQPCVRR